MKQTVEGVTLTSQALTKFWRSIRQDFPSVTLEQVQASAQRIKESRRNQRDVIDVLLYTEIKNAVDAANERNRK